MAQATVEAALYCPGMQAVHVVPASAVRVSVIDPGSQTKQLAKPAVLYSPAMQSAQATVELSVACPASQAVHVVAASAARVSVIDPGSQTRQLAKPAVLYSPAMQSAQTTVESSVACPASQAVH